MCQFLIIYKNHKRRRLYRNLRHIIKFQALSFVRRRLLHRHCLGKNLIEHTCLHSKRMILDNYVQQIKDFLKSLTCLSRNKYQFRLRHKG